ncbi:MAG: hypothetical protein ACOYL6_15215 [Bacteriovoracaceae bacterium]
MGKIIIIAMSVLLASNSHSFESNNILKKIQFKTYLSFLDNPIAVKCKEGNHSGDFPTSSILSLHSIVLSTPSENQDHKFQSQNLGDETCKELINEFNTHKNQYGTIPVTVTQTVDTGSKYSTFSLTNINGSNVGSRGSSHDYIFETIEFNVGSIRFTSFKQFAILRTTTTTDGSIIDLTPRK